MSETQTETQTETLPPKPKRKFGDWKERENRPFGEKLLDEIDPDRTALSPEQHAEILKIQDAEMLKNMLYSNLGETMNPDISTATKLFGPLLERKFEIPKMILTWRFYAMIQCMRVVEEGHALIADKTLTKAERINAIKASTEACKAMNMLTTNALTLAKLVGAVGKLPNAKPEPPKPKNEPPKLA